MNNYKLESKPKERSGKIPLKRLVRFFVHPFVRLYDIATPNDNRKGKQVISELSVLKRKDTGQYYRGSRWWKWCNNPRHAGWLKYDFWIAFITWKLDKEGIEYELIPIVHLEI